RRRDRAISLLLARRPVLVRRLQRAFLRWLLDHGPATSDVVRESVAIPTGIDPRVVGAEIRRLGAAELIGSAGRQSSRRAEAHGRKVDRWAIRDRVAALAWLDVHPELIVPEPTLFPDR